MGTGKIMKTITFNGIIFGYLKCCVSYKKKGGDLHFNVCPPNEQLRVFSESLIPRIPGRVALYILMFTCSLTCQHDDHIQKQSLFLRQISYFKEVSLIPK